LRRALGRAEAQGEVHLLVLELELGHVALFEQAEEPPQLFQIKVHGG
jgi:hypothetical protein